MKNVRGEPGECPKITIATTPDTEWFRELDFSGKKANTESVSASLSLNSGNEVNVKNADFCVDYFWQIESK